MNVKKLSGILLLFLCVVVNVFADDDEGDWTDPLICVAIAQHFNKAALAPLFGDHSREVNVVSGRQCQWQGCTSTCWVDIALPQDGSLGGFVLYRQRNAYQVFIENKKRLAESSAIVEVNLFPWVAEGFYYFKEGNTFQEYSAYTKTGDYVVISYNFFKLYPKPFRNQQPSTASVDDEFKTFIGSIGSQLYR